MYSTHAFLNNTIPELTSAGPAINTDCGHIARHAIRTFEWSGVKTTCSSCWRRESKQQQAKTLRRGLP